MAEALRSLETKHQSTGGKFYQAGVLRWTNQPVTKRILFTLSECRSCISGRFLSVPEYLPCATGQPAPSSRISDADLATYSILFDLDHERKVTCATGLMPRTRLATPTEQGEHRGKAGKTSAKAQQSYTRGVGLMDTRDMAMDREPLRPKEAERTSSPMPGKGLEPTPAFMHACNATDNRKLRTEQSDGGSLNARTGHCSRKRSQPSQRASGLVDRPATPQHVSSSPVGEANRREKAHNNIDYTDRAVGRHGADVCGEERKENQPLVLDTWSLGAFPRAIPSPAWASDSRWTPQWCPSLVRPTSGTFIQKGIVILARTGYLARQATWVRRAASLDLEHFRWLSTSV
ncbi:predicted protein [Chaetomium globosum CBS 148.51]|uniref:Uncharacterized protein n=1 Tax=Chaetomium globosum (strain ATCC 6205 / CBS 148.51 / DSM 1962 / NBRC 6347 / NRRL 1970) TaxID=306901 RepID=Q2GSH8_CHAGB|nr:uncharacterized protein CHGG_09076 [Chaetomium globosum CBS 148.51]EAQ85062.1 predicted protein [Chaetomium globosum CBS 148.51]